MLAIELLQTLDEHRRWARARVIARCETLPHERLRESFEMGVGSVWGTLVHMYGAELVWLDAIEEVSGNRFPDADDFADLAALRSAWTPLDERWSAWIAAADDSALRRMRSRTNRQGVTVSTEQHEIVLHVHTHAMYHLAQVTNMLRRLGVDDLPGVDLITMARDRHAGQRPAV